METRTPLPKQIPLVHESNTPSGSRQLKKFIDNRPSQIVQAKIISAMQKRSVIQKKKINELPLTYSHG